MTVTEVVQGLGSWTLQLAPETPKRITDALGFFGHVAIIGGPVSDVEGYGDALLAGARYVGVIRNLPKPDDRGPQLGGSGMVFWLGDEDGKGPVIETELDLSGKTLVQAVGLILNPVDAVTIGTIHAHAGTLPVGTKHLYVTARVALQAVCDAFGVEFRVNGDGSVDVGTAAELYTITNPDTVLVREGAGSDLDLTGLVGTFDVGRAVYDWSDRVVLVGRTVSTGDAPEEQFVTATSNVALNPYVDLFGNPVRATRIINDSTTDTGTAQARADLNRNRFGRVVRSFRLTSADYDTEGNFDVGDNVLVYDPETGITDPLNERAFRGRIIHPDTIRVTEATWSVRSSFTVAYRAQNGTWYDLTPFVTAETGGSDELVVGDLPRSLSRPGDDPLQARIDQARAGTDLTRPSPPTALVLDSDAYIAPSGETVANIVASWTPPTTNEDATVITDLSHFIVQYRWTGRAGFTPSGRTEDASTEISGLQTELPYEVRVAAVDYSGNVSDWLTGTITTEADDVAPPPPADPTLSSFLGQLKIDYSGVSAAATPMPSDTKQINVHVGAPGFTISAANRVDALPPFGKGSSLVTAALGVTTAVRFQAEDHAGNLSTPSAQVTGATTALTDSQIGSLAVGKLTTGTTTAVIVVGQRVTTALTGARTEMWTGGVRSFDGTETLTVNLDGVANLLTGRIQNALTGRRVVIDTFSFGGAVKFIAPDATEAVVVGYTDPNTGDEAIYYGIQLYAGTAPTWNGVQVSSNESVSIVSRITTVLIGGDATETNDGFVVEYVPARAAPNTNRRTLLQVLPASIAAHYQASGGVFQVNQRISGTSFTQMQMSSSGTFFFIPNTSNYRIGITSPSFGAVSSPNLLIVNGNNFGGIIFYGDNSGGTAARFEIKDGSNSVYIPLWASAFTVSSAEAGKDDIADLELDALALLDQIRPRRYRRKLPTEDADGKKRGGRGRASEEIGLVAEEAPAILRGMDGQGIDLYAYVTTLAAGLKALKRRMDEGEAP